MYNFTIDFKFPWVSNENINSYQIAVCVTGKSNTNLTLAKTAYNKICICKIWLGRSSHRENSVT